MYVRRKSNKTGTVSVHVVFKNRGRYKLVRSFGVGRTETEIVRLEEKARQFIRERVGLTSDYTVIKAYPVHRTVYIVFLIRFAGKKKRGKNRLRKGLT